MTDRYAVMGSPVAHSRSPFIHASFAGQTGQDLVYEAVEVEPGRFEAAARGFFAAGGRGLNVTVPFKEEAIRIAAVRTPRAQRAGAANTLWVEGDGAIGADNTDGVGLVRDLEANLGIAIRARRVLLLGAGGAALGVAGALLERAPAEIVVANRTPDRARALAARFADLGAIRACAFADLAGEARFDLVVNATSASLAGECLPVPEGAVAGADLAYDMVYGARPTAFLAWAERAGARRVADGLGMLVEQAGEAFARWRGVRPETRPVLEALRRTLAADARADGPIDRRTSD